MTGAFAVAPRPVSGEFLGKSAAPGASVLDRITVMAARTDATVVVIQARFAPAPRVAAIVRRPLDVMATEVDTAGAGPPMLPVARDYPVALSAPSADPTTPYARIQVGFGMAAQKGALLDVHA